MLNITAARKARRSPVELNMAPLIDMVFLLLIFFLATTSFVKETGVDVNRPVASTAVNKETASIQIAIRADNRIFMDRREIDIRAVRTNVERALAENPEGGVLIVADRLSSTGIAIQVLDGCRSAGARDVAIAAGLVEGE